MPQLGEDLGFRSALLDVGQGHFGDGGLRVIEERVKVDLVRLRERLAEGLDGPRTHADALGGFGVRPGQHQKVPNQVAEGERRYPPHSQGRRLAVVERVGGRANAPVLT